MIEVYIKADVKECKKFLRTILDSDWRIHKMTDFSPLGFAVTDGVVYMEAYQ